MACFSLGYIEHLLIWLVVIIGLVAVVKLFLPWLMAQVGGPAGGGIVMQILNIVIWVVITIFCIIIVFDLLACVIGTPSMNGSYIR